MTRFSRAVVGRNRWLAVICLSLAACGMAQTPSSPEGTPLPSGVGWRLLRYLDRVDKAPGIAFVKPDDAGYEIDIVVFGVGGGGCGRPQFDGFEPNGSTFVAKISRGPTPSGQVCLTTHQSEFDVLLDRDALPAEAAQIAINEQCDYAGCSASPVGLAR
jgi:hypothetical protein